MQQVIIYGAGGFAREVAWLIEDAIEAGKLVGEISCFIDDNPARSGTIVNDIPVMTFEEACERFPGGAFVLGIGSPEGREKLAAKVRAAGRDFLSVIHPNVAQSRHNKIGQAAVICAGTILTTNIELGDHVQINLDCTVGHDVRLGDFVTLAPGVHVSGRVEIGKGAYIGTGAVIINGSDTQSLIIGERATVGAGASVVRDIPAGVTAVGVPAKPRPTS